MISWLDFTKLKNGDNKLIDVRPKILYDIINLRQFQNIPITEILSFDEE